MALSPTSDVNYSFTIFEIKPKDTKNSTSETPKIEALWGTAQILFNRMSKKCPGETINNTGSYIWAAPFFSSKGTIFSYYVVVPGEEKLKFLKLGEFDLKIKEQLKKFVCLVTHLPSLYKFLKDKDVFEKYTTIEKHSEKSSKKRKK